MVLAYPASRLGLFDWPRVYDPLAVPDLRQPPGFLTQWQMKLVDAEPENCRAAFGLSGVSLAFKPKRVQGNCSLAGTAEFRKLSLASIQSVEMRCAIAARLYQWERHALQPAAQKLLGEPIAEILHFGSFSCRTMRGRSSMSEHSSANAFDISGFRTTSGKIISVKRDWNGQNAAGKFLRVAREGLCDWFNLTLSPDYNADHADHFHVDMGWYRSCR